MNTFKTGYAKVDITPSWPVPLSGYGNTHKRIHNNVLDPIYAVCVAVNDGENTLLLYHLDLTSTTDEIISICKAAIEEKYTV